MAMIEAINGSRYIWQKFPGLRTRGMITYCADGDGFVEVRELNGKC
jgi:hypothetical protein